MRLLTWCCLLLLTTDCIALTMGDAIDIAGRQRMLSQRIAQTYLLQGLQPEKGRHEIRLERAVREFQNNLDQLDAFVPADPIQPQLNAVAGLWLDYKTLATTTPNKSTAPEVIALSNQVLTAAHSYVMQLQELANHSSAELVNVSGRQRMLSQRIAKSYLAWYWGVDAENSLSNLYADLAEFDHMLQFLLDSPYNTEEINLKLRKTRGHFSYATRGFDGEMSLEGNRLIHVIIGTTDTMLYNMNEITQLYADVLDAQQQSQ